MDRLSAISPERLCAVEGVFADLDDTISTAGKVTAKAYDALWRLKDEGLFIVIVTGRPSGWCDHIARFWPVDGVEGHYNLAGYDLFSDFFRLQTFIFTDSDHFFCQTRFSVLNHAHMNYPNNISYLKPVLLFFQISPTQALLIICLF